MKEIGVKIDSEFHSLIPPLASDEYSQLESNIRSEGCRDPLVIWNGILLDGHNRLEICNKVSLPFKTVEIGLNDREAAKDWIISNQLGRRNITRDQWEYLLGVRYNRMKKEQGQRGNQKTGQNDPFNGHATAELLAKEYGVAEKTVRRAGKTAELLDANPKEKKAVLKKRKRIRSVKEDIKKKKQKEKRKQAAKGISKLNPEIIIGDFKNHADKIPDGSLSLIFTDPPYNRGASKLLPDLAQFAANKLAEGGSLLCYVGQTQLPSALDAFRQHLRYWWVIACIHAGHSTVMREYGINAGWKAVLWFVKGTRDDKQTMVSDVMSGGQEKDFHDWQQSQSEAEYWIQKLCPVDGIVCDPFLGSGTTAKAAKRLGRKWIGIEIDEETAKIASGRLL